MMAMAIVTTVAITPLQACPAAGGGVMLMMNGGDHGQPMQPKACDSVCLACLVQPEPVRIVVTTGWTLAVYAPRKIGLTMATIAPDVPPPQNRVA